jgi:hypothetical protein
LDLSPATGQQLWAASAGEEGGSLGSERHRRRRGEEEASGAGTMAGGQGEEGERERRGGRSKDGRWSRMGE